MSRTHGCLPAVAAASLVCALTSYVAAAPLRVDHLRVELLEQPQGIDSALPLLSWQVLSDQRNQVQSAYRIRVAGNPEALAAGRDLIWDSGKVASERTLVRYSGRPIGSGEQCYWQVQVWNGSGEPSLWSASSQWSAGLLHAGDWQGSWIGASVNEDPRTVHSGYQAQPSSTDREQSVTVDLSAVQSVDAVVLHPATRIVGPHTPGYGFPLRFRIETSLDGDHFDTAVDRSSQDLPNPGYSSVPFPLHGKQARLVRLTVVKLWHDPEINTDVPYRFALGELEVLQGSRNLALNAPVFANTSVESGGWGLRYLGDGQATFDPSAAHAGDAEILLGRSIRLAKPARRAAAYFSGLGFGELSINGVKIGDHELDPGHTDYTRRVLYTTFDVTASLHPGDNLLGLTLGNGWFHLPTADLFGNEKAPWAAPPQAILNLRIEYADGQIETIVTDGSWRWGTGPVVYNSVRGGETIDRSHPAATWQDFPDPQFWRPVKVVRAPAGQLHGQEEQPVRILETVKPIRLTEPNPGVYVFDFGVNMAGTVRFVAHGEKDQRVTLQFNERLNPDGTLDAYHEAKWHTYGRYQTGELILSGGPSDVFDPRFSYHGFQYVQITGLQHPPSLSDIDARILDTDARQTGSFRCSNEKFNKLQAAILRTERNYNMGFPNDPLREKTGWTQDIFNDLDVSLLNFDLGPVYRRWFHDILDAQDGDGHVPSIAPTPGWGRVLSTGTPGEMSDVWWGGTLVYLPWAWYRHFGDTSLIEEGYPSAKRYLHYLSTTAGNDLIDWGLGDWGDSPGGSLPVHTSRAQTVSAGYFYLASIVAQEAELLGHTEDARQFHEMAERIRSAYNRTWFNPQSGAYSGASQTAEDLPLFVGLVPPDHKASTFAALVKSVHQANDHLRTGFVGLAPLMEVLSTNGNVDLTYKIANQEDVPGWWSMIKDGGTTVTEYWDPHVGTRNLINLAGPLGAWFYRSLAGIRPDPLLSGYKHFLLTPQPVGDLTYAEAKTDTIHGQVASSWRLNGSRLNVDVTVPANTTATLTLPVPETSAVIEGGAPFQPVAAAAGSAKIAPHSWATELGSGAYHFETSYTPATDRE
jgi:alpha-L-rhamnosidase